MKALHFKALAWGDPLRSDIPLKTRFFGLHVACRMYRSVFKHFYAIGRKIRLPSSAK